MLIRTKKMSRHNRLERASLTAGMLLFCAGAVAANNPYAEAPQDTSNDYSGEVSIVEASAKEGITITLKTKKGNKRLPVIPYSSSFSTAAIKLAIASKVEGVKLTVATSGHGEKEKVDAISLE